MKGLANWYKRYLGWFWKHKVISAIIVLIIIVAVAIGGKNKPVKTGPLPNLDSRTTQNIDPTNNFVVSANWGINWNYDCTKVNPQPGSFYISVQDPDGTYS